MANKTQHGYAPAASAPDIVARCLHDPSIIRLLVGPKASSEPLKSPDKLHGECPQLLVVHEKLACHHSSYFRAIFAGSSSFSERISREIVWEDEDVNVVMLFISWLYLQKIDLYEHGVTRSDDEEYPLNDELVPMTAIVAPKPPEPCDDEVATIEGEYRALFKLYAFADRRGLPTLANMAISELYRRFLGRAPTWLIILSAWRASPRSSKLRSFLVDAIALTYRIDLFNSGSYELPTALLTLLPRRADWEGRSEARWYQT